MVHKVYPVNHILPTCNQITRPDRKMNSIEHPPALHNPIDANAYRVKPPGDGQSPSSSYHRLYH